MKKTLFLFFFLIREAFSAGMISNVDGEMAGATETLKAEIQSEFQTISTSMDKVKTAASEIKTLRESENSISKAIQSLEIEQEIVWSKISHKLGIAVLNE